MTCAAHIRIESYQTTRPIVKLYPLEVSSLDEINSQRASNNATNDSQDSRSAKDKSGVRSGAPSRQHTPRKVASKALKKIAEWTTLSRSPPEDIGND